jgi:hypothetical protein
MHHHHSHSRYLIHNYIYTLLSDPVIGTIVKVPIQVKMDYDDEDLDGFHFGTSQESKLDPPLVLESSGTVRAYTAAKMAQFFERNL